MSVDNQWRTVILSLVLLLLLPLQPPCLGVPIVIPSKGEQQDETIAIDSPFAPVRQTSSKLEVFDSNRQDSRDQTGFISPSSLRTLYIDGSALAECKLVCRLILSMITNKTNDEAGSGQRSAFTTTSCSLKRLMVFSGLKAGKYLLSSRCDAGQLCYTDPTEKVFEVTTTDGATKMVHLGNLMTFSRPQKNITEEQTFESLDNGGSYTSACDEAWRKNWRTFISIGVISSVVALGLVLISSFAEEEQRR